MVLCLPVNVIIGVVLSVIIHPGVILYEGARAPGVRMAGWDRTVSVLLAKAMGVGTGVTVVPPAVAVPTVAVLGAGDSEMPHLVAGVAAHPGLKVSWAIDTDVANVATHGTKVVHVNDWGGGGKRWGILQCGGTRGKGDGDVHDGGGRADSVRGEGASLTLISVMVVLLANGTRRGGGLALSLILLLSLSSVRWNRNRA